MHLKLHSLRLIVLGILSLQASAQGAEIQLLNDSAFMRGFALLAPSPGERKVQAVLAGDAKGAKPVWEVAQWFSKWPDPKPDAAGSAWENAGKRIGLQRTSDADAELALTVRGSAEYGETARKGTEPWAHLLVEQHISDSPPLSDLRELRLRIASRLDDSRVNAPELYDPTKHAAQFLLYLHISNTDRKSPEYGHYLHFGVPIYDNRHRFPTEYFAPDPGTGMVIYMPGAREYSQASLHDGDWVEIDRDILPLIRAGLERAWKSGTLASKRDLGSYKVTFITLGWELPGNLDATVRIKGLALTGFR
jgi:hypothetical protein